MRREPWTALRNLGYFLRGRLNASLGRTPRRRADPWPAPAPLEPLIEAAGALARQGPLALVPLLESRTNAEREGAVARYLTARGLAFARHRFDTLEGRGENLAVDVGAGDRVLVLIAHHDAVEDSPGANDNAAAVGILLALVERLPALVPPGVRVRCLFTAAEERGYLGARAWVREGPLDGIIGVLSLELCGIGDTLVVWDASEPSPFLATVTGALDGIGLRADEGYHVVGRIPLFGSDHRAFASAGIPAYGLTVVPAREVEALRRFVLSPMRGVLRQVLRRPRPFDTYHTPDDAAATLEPGAVAAATRALAAIVAAAR